jgi:glycine cleavage system H lipoate-binding protein
VQRKRKRNGKKPTFVHPQSCLAEITCSDNTSYFVYSCISGKLVELNDTLLTNPHLVSEKVEFSCEKYSKYISLHYNDEKLRKETTTVS